MGVPIIFSGNNAKTLKPNIDLFGNVTINSGALDPTSVAVSANLGSLYISTSTGLIYQKLDNGSSVNWVVLGQGSNVSNPVTFSPSIDGIGVSSSNVTWSRDGAYMEIQGSVTALSASASNMAINLPNSAVVASSYDATTYTTVGWGARDDASAGNTKFIMAICKAGDSKVYLAMASEPAGRSPLAPAPANSQVAGGQNFAFFVRVKIDGWLAATAVTRTAPKITTYTSSSGTHTLTGSPLYIRVRMVGGGGGGGGGTTVGAGTDGGDGGDTTFGASLLVASHGTKGIKGSVAVGAGGAGAGGSASLGSGPTGTVIRGGDGSCGGGGLIASGAGSGSGGDGGSSAFGGNGGGGSTNQAGSAAAANSGAGGAGGGAGSGSGFPGGGGGAGGFVDAIISSPSASYSYVVGSAGTAGTGDGGTSGANGGAGGSGYIEVTEYYQ